MVDSVLAAEPLAAGPSPPTGRERDVLIASRDSPTVATSAARLFLSEGTVRNYLSSVIAGPARAIGPRPCGSPKPKGGSKAWSDAQFLDR